MMKRTLCLFGTSEACENARLLMENLPQIKRIDVSDGSRQLLLLLHEPVSEKMLIPFLAKSGISGFRFY